MFDFDFEEDDTIEPCVVKYPANDAAMNVTMVLTCVTQLTWSRCCTCVCFLFQSEHINKGHL